MEQESLKPCPFCGRDAGLYRWHRSEDVMLHRVLCENTECIMCIPYGHLRFAHWYETEQEAIDEWNTRAQE